MKTFLYSINGYDVYVWTTGKYEVYNALDVCVLQGLNEERIKEWCETH